jgi:uncharacterized NAD(P)/FAD-binding protein YdhS
MAVSTSHLAIAIVGGGAAGTFLAIELANRLSGRCRITMFDRGGQFGRGLAYSSTAPWHRLNVPASKMGGRNDDDPNGFIDWLTVRGHLRSDDYASAFMSRSLYGDYLCELLADVAAAGILTMRHVAVAAVEPCHRGYRVRTETANDLDADVVALCLGNPAPAPFAHIPITDRWLGDVWRQGALTRIGPEDDVLIIGSGSTAVDVTLDLVHRGIGRRILMVSRKGLLPRLDAPVAPYAGFQELDLAALNMRGALRMLRREIASATAAGTPWQSVFDAFRQHAAPIWRRSSDAEQRRFLRHLQSLWLVHRHRLAPDVWNLLTRLTSQGILSIVAGRVIGAEPVTNGYRVSIAERSGRARSLVVAWIANCAGPQQDYQRLADPLTSSLLAAGRARPGPQRLGLDVDDDGRLLDSAGRPQSGLYLLGPATRGRFWEITAVPWIRARAASVAGDIAHRFQA